MTERKGPLGRFLATPNWQGVAGLTGLVGAVIAALALVVSIKSPPSNPPAAPPPGAPPAAASPADPIATVGRLAAGVQVGSYRTLLGEPLVKRPVLDRQGRPTENLEWIWQRPQYVVQAVVDPNEQVRMYTLTATDSSFHPSIPMTSDLPGGPMRLGRSRFSEFPPDLIVGSEAVYPADAEYHYSEIVGPAGATHERALIMTTSWDGAGGPAPSLDAIDRLNAAITACNLDPTGFTPCPDGPGRAALNQARSALYVTGYSLTAVDFDPSSVDPPRSPWLLDSDCDVPTGCR